MSSVAQSQRPRAAVEKHTAGAAETFDGSKNSQRERPRIKATATLGTGGTVAGILMSAGGDVLPNVVRIPLATVIATLSAVPAVKEYVADVQKVIRDRKKRREGKGDSADR